MITLNHWKILRAGDYIFATGTVAGHPRLPDTHNINTSMIMHVGLDYVKEELVLETLNSVYHCAFRDCLFDEETLLNVPELAALKNKYSSTDKLYDMPEDSVLIVLSNKEHYYFEAVLCNAGGTMIYGTMTEKRGFPQDECHIRLGRKSMGIGLEIRYYPHPGSIEIYQWLPAKGITGKIFPVYVRNTGTENVYVRISKAVIKVAPDDTVLLDRSNVLAEEDIPWLVNNDLYPTIFIVNDKFS